MRNAKAFLREIRYEQNEILRLQFHLEYLRKSLLPGGIRYDKAQVQSSISDKTSEVLAQIGDLETMIREDTLKLLKKTVKAQRMISGLESSEQRQIMREYYLSAPDEDLGLPTWNDVARITHYSRAHVLRLHGEALRELNKK